MAPTQDNPHGRAQVTALVPTVVLLLIYGMLVLPHGAFAEGKTPAPAFPDGLSWLNVSRPLSLEDLRGRVVVLDFWTYGCINCLHVAEELKHLEERFGDDLVVIAVHSPKFENERRLATLRRFVLRYGRTHPVVSDPDMQLMHLYHARAWPTLFVLDPEGHVEGYVAGEGHEALLERTIARLLRAHPDRQPRALPLALESEKVLSSFLAAPGKVSTDGHRVAISDTLHHRLVITDTEGHLLKIVGEGRPGLRDGGAPLARFNAPQGSAFVGDALYVADTGNHALRRIALDTWEVELVAGTGTIGELQDGDFDAREVGLRSPWDLARDGDILYVAMAGTHQIWQYDPGRGRLSRWAGSGREGIRDGELDSASFSQPSGLAIAQRHLYVADPEASAIRRIDLATRRVDTLIGTGLFDFGDRDGTLALAQLQHPLGVAVTPDHRLLIADTYNHKLKVADLPTGSIVTLLGSGRPGAGDVDRLELNEPAGITVLGSQILIADTNNDRIVAYDLDSSQARVWAIDAGADPAKAAATQQTRR